MYILILFNSYCLGYENMFVTDKRILSTQEDFKRSPYHRIPLHNCQNCKICRQHILRTKA